MAGSSAKDSRRVKSAHLCKFPVGFSYRSSPTPWPSSSMPVASSTSAVATIPKALLPAHLLPRAAGSDEHPTPQGTAPFRCHTGPQVTCPNQTPLLQRLAHRRPGLGSHAWHPHFIEPETGIPQIPSVSSSHQPSASSSICSCPLILWCPFSPILSFLTRFWAPS